ncbi:hypothetical protein EV384_1499 [Micromonospora kangleipakensis]|uniref:Uncharacterized protein n=1 Tax=Micromonospora kangleipakensis TaxID=1077942 RepID=A0A4Q8B651_9ACTN|nr:hypothetical protein [Micromonospora kangleipakensis]RZU73102.1 hypothetical protein EV384_1499 [Micromonospora kangleipakensis]
MSLPGPAVYVRHDDLWPRRLLSLAVAAAVAAVAAAGLLRARQSDLDDVQFVVWLVTGAHLLEKRWRPQRTGRLVWRARAAGRDATEPGLVAGRSFAGWVDLAADATMATTLAVGLISLLPDDPGWARIARPGLLVAVAVGLGRLAYREVRVTGRLALTASGIRHGRRWYAWSDVDGARLHTQDGRADGVWLRVRQPPALPPVVGGRSVAVADELLLAAIDHFRTRPEVLAVGLPVTAPEPAVEPAGG